MLIIDNKGNIKESTVRAYNVIYKERGYVIYTPDKELPEEHNNINEELENKVIKEKPKRSRKSK